MDNYEPFAAIGRNAEMLGGQSLPLRYLKWLKETLSGAEDAAFREQYLPVIREARAVQTAHPFLTVILRTQGTRRETLKEALASLEAQSDSDFEILLILHKADERGKRETAETVAELRPETRERLRLCETEEDGRTAPLNLGAAMAYGQYFAMLDDDDLVFADWVRNFHRAAQTNDGRVLRCYGLTQLWKMKDTANGRQPIAVEKPVKQYCEPFCLELQLTENRTPISCAAIPTVCFQRFGICFDGKLETTEDWDYIMRCALLCGVVDTGEITFLYRQWKNAESSQTRHSRREWEENRLYIMKKFREIPIVTSADEIRSNAQRRGKKRPFRVRLKQAIRKYGVFRLPFVLLGKCLRRLRNREISD